jgi:hypothetical protein
MEVIHGMRHKLLKAIARLGSAVNKYAGVIRRPSNLRPAYAKVSRAHRLIIVGLYVLVALFVVAMLRDLGSHIRTRSLPTGSIVLSTNYSTYLVGDPVAFTVTNNYNSAVYITNNCPAEPLEVYRLEGSTWVHIHDTIDQKECPTTERQVRIPARSNVTGDFSGWKKLFEKPGKYRVVAYVDYYNSLPHSDFEVIAKPAVPEIPALLPPKPVVVTPPSRSASTSSSSSTPSSTTTQNQPTAPSRQTKTITLSVGTLVVEYTSTTVYVISVSPASGYRYEGGGSGTNVEITFKKSGQDDVQLTLSMRNGQLTQRVESDD